jgi:hypothetical protein
MFGLSAPESIFLACLSCLLFAARLPQLAAQAGRLVGDCLRWFD